MTKPTPGPWRYQWNRPFAPTVTALDFAGRPFIVAECIRRDPVRMPSHQISQQEAVANAQLIATAPDMHRTLSTVRAALDIALARELTGAQALSLLREIHDTLNNS